MTKLATVDTVRLIVSILLCECAGFLGSIATTPQIPRWYAGLVKPSFTPPAWLFAPVWTTLYFLMGVSLFLVWRIGLGHGRVKAALSVFAAQLILNVLWSFAFFGWRSPLAGLVVIAALWVMIVLTIMSFSRLSMAAAVLLVPYILWVSFAAVLNAAIYRLNP
jgi:benzodiazapine receptor